MTQHTITVTLTEDAQRAALLAGQPAAQEQTYEVPQELLPRLLALPWTRVDRDGRAQCVLPMCGALRTACDRRPADAAEAIAAAEAVAARIQAEQERRRQAEAEAERARREAELARREAARAAAERWAALPLDWRIADGGVALCRPSESSPDYSGPLQTSGYRVVSYEDLRKYVPDALRQAEAEAERRRKEEERRRKEAREHALARLREWSLAHGSERVRLLLEEQHAAWIPVAEDEYLTAHTPEGYSASCVVSGAEREVKERTRPTAADILALREARALAEASGGVLRDPEMVWVVERYPDDPPDVAAKYSAISLIVAAPTGAQREVFRRVE